MDDYKPNTVANSQAQYPAYSPDKKPQTSTSCSLRYTTQEANQSRGTTDEDLTNRKVTASEAKLYTDPTRVVGKPCINNKDIASIKKYFVKINKIFENSQLTLIPSGIKYFFLTAVSYLNKTDRYNKTLARCATKLLNYYQKGHNFIRDASLQIDLSLLFFYKSDKRDKSDKDYSDIFCIRLHNICFFNMLNDRNIDQLAYKKEICNIIHIKKDIPSRIPSLKDIYQNGGNRINLEIFNRVEEIWKLQFYFTGYYYKNNKRIKKQILKYHNKILNNCKAKNIEIGSFFNEIFLGFINIQMVCLNLNDNNFLKLTQNSIEINNSKFIRSLQNTDTGTIEPIINKVSSTLKVITDYFARLPKENYIFNTDIIIQPLKLHSISPNQYLHDSLYTTLTKDEILANLNAVEQCFQQLIDAQQCLQTSSLINQEYKLFFFTADTSDQLDISAINSKIPSSTQQPVATKRNNPSLTSSGNYDDEQQQAKKHKIDGFQQDTFAMLSDQTECISYNNSKYLNNENQETSKELTKEDFLYIANFIPNEADCMIPSNSTPIHLNTEQRQDFTIATSSNQQCGATYDNYEASNTSHNSSEDSIYVQNLDDFLESVPNSMSWMNLDF